VAQHDYDIANDTGANFRADVNAMAQAVRTSNSGGSAPTPFPYLFWADTTNNLLKMRNGANTAWITLCALDAAAMRMLVGAGAVGTPAYSTEGDTNTGMWFPAADTIAWGVGGVEAVRINNARQTETPAGSATIPALTTTGDLNTGMFYPAADTIAWTTGGTERGRVDSSGRLLWGSTASVYAGTRASLWATSASQAALEVVNTSTAGNTLICRVNDASSNFVAFDYAGTVLGSINTNGVVTQYNTTSDRRLKRDIEDLGDVGPIIDLLRPRRFFWRGTGEVDFGFVAQELAPVVARAVTAGDDGEEIERPWQVDEAKLVPLLTAELQRLRARVAALESA
jgi:hypothetical protein